jgi:hypothetical protein
MAANLARCARSTAAWQGNGQAGRQLRSIRPALAGELRAIVQQSRGRWVDEESGGSRLYNWLDNGVAYLTHPANSKALGGKVFQLHCQSDIARFIDRLTRESDTTGQLVPPSERMRSLAALCRAVALIVIALMTWVRPTALAAQGLGGGADTSALSTAKYYALLVAVESYTDAALPRLNAPARDAEQLKKVLTEQYRFEPGNVNVLRDAKREKVLSELRRLTDQLGPNDNLLIFYAGHGIWDEGSKQSYWLPVDARRVEDTQWISNDDIGRYLRRSKARHILVIADACYAGAMLMRDAGDNASSELLYSRPSRRAMTSGSKEVVPDQSVFLQYVIQRLRENKRPYLSALNLFSSLQDAVMSNSQVVPQFAPIQSVGHEGGDFLFPLRDSTQAVDATIEQRPNASDSTAVTRRPSTALELVEAENQRFVDFIKTKNTEMLGTFYASEIGTAPEWKEKLLKLVREDLTSARLTNQQSLLDANSATSTVEVSIQYKNPVAGGTQRATLHFIVRYARFNDRLTLRNYSLTQKPPF